MKKFFKVTGNIFAYLFIYLGLQFRVAFISAIPVTLIYLGDTRRLTEALQNLTFIVTTIAAVIAFLFYVLIFKDKEENLFQRCRFNKLKLRSSLYVLISAIGLSSLTCSFVALYGDKFKSYVDVSETIITGRNSFMTMLCLVVFVPIFEEILFRGLVFNELRKNTNLVLSVILQAILFGVFHMNILQGIYTSVLAIALALIYIWTNSIWAPILLHMFYNLLGTSVIPKLLYKTSDYIYWYVGIGLLLTISFIFGVYLTEKNNPGESLTV